MWDRLKSVMTRCVLRRAVGAGLVALVNLLAMHSSDDSHGVVAIIVGFVVAVLG